METTIIMSGSKYRVKYDENNVKNYKVFRQGIDVTEELKQNIVTDMFYHILRLQDKIEDMSVEEGRLKEETLISDDEFKSIFPCVRPYSVNSASLLSMLDRVSMAMIERITNEGIYLKPNSVKIWVKQYADKLYPKIEFDVNGQELQYDLNHDGTINEVHFKKFEKSDDENCVWKRRDIPKHEANRLLRTIDNILS